MKAFVTGGSGFIGTHVVRKLIARGDDVIALAHSEKSVADLEAMGARVIQGDITDMNHPADQDPIHAGMLEADVVYHLAGWYKIGVQDQIKMALINVEGTRNILALAYELGVPKIVYASSVVVFGDTQGRLVDESFYQAGPFDSVYHRTKWQAHYEVAVPFIEKGAPIVIVMPSAVYGPHDDSLVSLLMRLFYQGALPVLPGANLMLSYVYVEDVAEGIIQAADRGKIGEAYLLTGPSLTLKEATILWADLLDRRPPVGIPGEVFQPLAPILGALNRAVKLPSVLTDETIRLLKATYIARSDKAREQLGWRPRPLREGLRETFDWIASTTPPPQPRKRKAAGLALATALFILLIWLLTRKRKRSSD
jgi:nucleoside-diphosphate-sugar epimerase